MEKCTYCLLLGGGITHMFLRQERFHRDIDHHQASHHHRFTHSWLVEFFSFAIIDSR